MKRRTTSTGNLQRLLGSGSTPLFIVNARRKLLVFNHGFEQLTGWKADDVVGRTCHYGSSGETAPDNLTASLCPPPNVFAGEDATVPVFLPHRDGRSLGRMLSYFPFVDDSHAVSHVLGIATIIREPAPALEPSTVQTLHAELADLRGQLRRRFGLDTLVCRTGATAKLLDQIELARSCTANVFLKGEPGVGKEHIARVIHYAGSEKTTTFVPLNCRVLSPSEIDRTLTRLLENLPAPDRTTVAARQTGTEKVTGSSAGPAVGGLYLADVEHLPRDLQKRIVVEFERTPSLRHQLRLFSSSTCDLQEAAKTETVLPQLYSLLTTITIEIPPLRERPADVPLLVQHFLEERNRAHEQQIGGFADEPLRLLRRYNWPGNIEELKKVVREACDACSTGTVTDDDLPFRFRTGLDAQRLPPPAEHKPLPLDKLLGEYEAQLIGMALERTRQNKSKAAAILGINRPRLYRRMENLGIEDTEEQE